MKNGIFSTKVSFAAGAGGISILYLLFFILYTPAFETNDDALMNFIAAGSLTGESSAYILFSNFLWGTLLNGLFRLSSFINWYSISFFCIHYLSALSIFGILQKKNDSSRFFFLFCIVILIFQFNFLLKLQFTSTGFVAAIAGLINLWFYIEGQHSRKYFRRAFLFFTISALIRQDTLIAVLIFSATPFVLRFFRNKKNWSWRWHYLLLLLPFLLHPLNKEIYIAAGSGYPAYQQTAHILLDYNEKLDAQTLEENHFSENDWHLFQTYFRSDPNFGYDRLEPLKKAAEPGYDPAGSTGILYNYAFSFLFFPATCLIFLWIFIFLDRRDRLIIALHFILLNLILFILAAHFKLPHRVYVPALFTGVIIWLFLYGDKIGQISYRRTFVNRILLLCMTIISIVQCTINYHISNKNKLQHTEMLGNAAIINNEKGTLFIAVDCSPGFFQFPLFKEPPDFPNHNFIPGATFTFSPVYADLIKMNGLGNLSSDLQNRSVVIINEDPDFFSCYKIFMLEHYGIRIHFDAYAALPFAQRAIWE